MTYDPYGTIPDPDAPEETVPVKEGVDEPVATTAVPGPQITTPTNPTGAEGA